MRQSSPVGLQFLRNVLCVGSALFALGGLAGCEQDTPPKEARIPEQLHLNAYEQSFGYSQAVKVGRTVYISATMPVDKDGKLVSPGDMAGQLDAVYANLEASLKAEGAGFPQVVMERIYTTNMDDLLKLSDRRFTYYSKGQLPATSWIEVRKLVDPGFLVAVEAVAELP
jgi:enamine deaminase RidA (YjgF/YER057c/UK114 family)